MKRFFKKICTVVVLTLVIAMLTPAGLPALDDSEIIYTALNNRLLPLSDTCPLVRDGVIYVTYDIFNSELQCVSVYSAANKNVLIYDWNYMLTFDLAKNTSTDQSGVSYSAHAISARGTIYVPAEFVCERLGLKYSYLSTGPTVRVCSGTNVDEELFIQTLTASIPTILKKYRSSQTVVTPVEPPKKEEEDDPVSPVVTENVRVSLAFATDLGASTAEILDQLAKQNVSAVFWVENAALDNADGDLLRRILGEGHSIGILADTPESAQMANDSVKLIAKTRTRLVCTDSDFGDFSRAGYLPFRPTFTVSVSSGVQVLRSAKIHLADASGAVTLYLTNPEAAASALPDILKFIKSGSFELRDYGN